MYHNQRDYLPGSTCFILYITSAVLVEGSAVIICHNQVKLPCLALRVFKEFMQPQLGRAKEKADTVRSGTF